MLGGYRKLGSLSSIVLALATADCGGAESSATSDARNPGSRCDAGGAAATSPSGIRAGRGGASAHGELRSGDASLLV